MIRELIKTIDKDFFDVRVEMWKTYRNDPGTSMISAYSKEGYYIGSPEEIADKYIMYGICEDLTPLIENIQCGYSPRDQKYYGWSHRGIYGFGIGSKVKKGDLAYIPSIMEEMREG